MRIIWRATRTTLLAAWFLPASTPSMAAPDSGAVQLVDASPSLSFDKPVYMTHAPDGSDRMFVITQRGTKSRLLGLAVDPAYDPAYTENGRFYVNCTTGAGQAGSWS